MQPRNGVQLKVGRHESRKARRNGRKIVEPAELWKLKRWGNLVFNVPLRLTEATRTAAGFLAFGRGRQHPGRFRLNFSNRAVGRLRSRMQPQMALIPCPIVHIDQHIEVGCGSKPKPEL